MRRNVGVAVLLVVGCVAVACGGDDASSAGGGSATSGGGGSGNGSGSGSGGDAATGSGGGHGGAPPSCGAFQTGDDFLACAATYTTGEGADVVGGVDVGPDGTVVVAGSIAAGDLGATATTLLGGGAAGILRLSVDGRSVVGVTRLGGAATDVAVRQSTGEIAVSGDFGVALLDAAAQAVIWSDAAPGGDAREVAIGQEGTVAVLAGTTLSVFSAEGAPLGSFNVPTNQEVTDVAVDDVSQTVFATGYKQDDGYTCTQLQIPFIRAYAFDGAPRWHAYDWDKVQAGDASECADSRGYGLAMGRDGKLYYVGESHGGNTVHRRLPQDLTAMAPVVKTDAYNDPYNLNGAAPIGFYGRFDPATGALEQGQFLNTRLSSGKGNAARPRAIAADAQGNVFVAGGSACCIEGGDVKTVNGAPAMPTYAGGGFVLVVSADFQQRLAWTAFNGELGGGADGISVAVGPTSAALVMRQAIDPAKNASTSEIPLLTFNAAQPAPGGGESDGYLVVFPAP